MAFRESDTVEFKSEVVSDLCKEIIAFANTRGGILYIGVRDDGSVVGIADADKTLLQISNMVRDSIKPDVSMFVRYSVMDIDARQVISVAVQRGTDRPYYLGGKGLKPGGVFVRNGTSTDPAGEASIRKMIRDTDGESFEALRSLEQELTFRSSEKVFNARNVAFDDAKKKNLGIMTLDGVYSNVGLLLSDQCPFTIKAATFSGKDQTQFHDRREFTGSLLEQMEDLYAYLELRNETRAEFKGLYRTDRRSYPENAIREALMNSLVHRDYAISASTLVSIYSDRLEFVSVGGLADGVSLEDVMLGLSVCRNPKLANVFYRLSLIEAYGTGLPKIMRSYDGTGLKPQITATSNAFKIVLPSCNAVNETLSPLSQEERILAFLNEHEYIVRSDVDALLNVSQSTANRLLKRMAADGLINQNGKGTNTKYTKKAD